MSDPFDERLRVRLERLSDAIPVTPPGSAPSARRDAPRRSLRAVLLAVALVVLASLGATAAILQLQRPAEQSGAFSEGGPLHCSGIDQLSPADAERWLITHGLTASWQVEDRDAGTTTTTDAAPDRGTIIDALATGERTVLVLVDLGRSEPLPPRPCP